MTGTVSERTVRLRKTETIIILLGRAPTMTDQKTYLDEFLHDPKRLAEQLRRGFEEEVTAETMDEEEKKDLEAAMTPPPKGERQVKAWLGLKGEGGSGELRRSVEEEIENRTDAYGRDLNAVDEENQPSAASQDKGGSQRKGKQKVGRLEKGEAEDMTVQEVWAYVNECNSELNDRIVRLMERVDRLEQSHSATVPITRIGPGTHVRQHSRPGEGSGPTPITNSPPRSVSKRMANVSEALVRRFCSENRTYPSYQKVRQAKLQSLAAANGITRPMPDVSASQWTYDGIVAILTETN